MTARSPRAKLVRGGYRVCPAQGPPGVAQVVDQGLPKPGRQTGVVAVKLIDLGVRLQQGLLHDVRGVDAVPRSGVELHPGQQEQIRPKLFERALPGAFSWFMRGSLCSLKRRADMN